MLCGEAYGGVGRGGGEESDRLDHECTHRHTLFNVSLTFLFSISSLLTRSRRRDGQQRRRGEREMERVSGGRRQRSFCSPTKVPRPRQSQGSGFTRGPANQEARRGENPVPLGDHSFYIHLLPSAPFVFSLPTPAVFHPSVPSFIP